jgi:hypothetical protein
LWPITDQSTHIPTPALPSAASGHLGSLFTTTRSFLDSSPGILTREAKSGFSRRLWQSMEQSLHAPHSHSNSNLQFDWPVCIGIETTEITLTSAGALAETTHTTRVPKKQIAVFLWILNAPCAMCRLNYAKPPSLYL